MLRDPERTTGIFSFKQSLAKSFLKQIKTELEINVELKTLFDDILFLIVGWRLHDFSLFFCSKNVCPCLSVKYGRARKRRPNADAVDQ